MAGGVLLAIGIGYIAMFYGLLKGKRVGMDYNYNIAYHRNRYTNNFHICYYRLLLLKILRMSSQELWVL